MKKKAKSITSNCDKKDVWKIAMKTPIWHRDGILLTRDSMLDCVNKK